MYVLCLIGKEDRANVQKRVHYCDRKKKNLRLNFGVNDHLVHPFRSQISVLFGNCFRKSFAGHRTGLCIVLRFNKILLDEKNFISFCFTLISQSLLNQERIFNWENKLSVEELYETFRLSFLSAL